MGIDSTPLHSFFSLSWCWWWPPTPPDAASTLPLAAWCFLPLIRVIPLASTGSLPSLLLQWVPSLWLSCGCFCCRFQKKGLLLCCSCCCIQLVLLCFGDFQETWHDDNMKQPLTKVGSSLI